VAAAAVVAAAAAEAAVARKIRNGKEGGNQSWKLKAPLHPPQKRPIGLRLTPCGFIFVKVNTTQTSTPNFTAHFVRKQLALNRSSSFSRLFIFFPLSLMVLW